MCQISILFGLIKFVDNKSNVLIGVLGGVLKLKITLLSGGVMGTVTYVSCNPLKINDLPIT